ncbi:hypothetical protein K431DRAFT_306406 [Polychaeton citri CBS 116435]|uniref:Alpha/beta hydrolase fold-3 domain-containing protein n=1 Tax=Polychaeton citri CBS 116435 TaxID=1314669 RepID=A0A9P4Q4H7_9PEZI|nr:hypothetical protein K431DRAFT_306406 [Polychaeton citri CBS 116435]
MFLRSSRLGSLRVLQHPAGNEGFLRVGRGPYASTAAYRISTFSSSACRASAAESINVPCRGNDNVVLDIHYPSAPPSAAIRSASGPASVVLYLSNGLSDTSATAAEEDAALTALRSGLPHLVVKVKYTCGERLRYPNVIHQTLAGYDWAVEHLLPRRAITRPGRSSRVGQIAVLGQHVGGSLATMLALTECRVGEPGIVAAAIHDPVLDWISLGTAAEEDEVARMRPSPDLDLATKSLLHLRRLAFAKPQAYFDPFASPILFLRSAGVTVPPPPKLLDDLEQLSLLDREDFFREQQALSAATIDPSLLSAEDEQQKPAKRMAALNFPSKALGLQLPYFQVSSNDDSCLNGQAQEFTKRLRRGVVRQRAQAVSSFGRKALLPDEMDEMDEEERLEMEAREFEAERKVQFTGSGGNGSWNVNSVIPWLKQVLE